MLHALTRKSSVSSFQLHTTNYAEAFFCVVSHLLSKLAFWRFDLLVQAPKFELTSPVELRSEFDLMMIMNTFQ
jgi:hypothetical protein